jgi:energy-converting hydrogenase Eha subunit G
MARPTKSDSFVVYGAFLIGFLAGCIVGSELLL